jgi:thiol-disulfide isomerase/thioredoxin
MNPIKFFLLFLLILPLACFSQLTKITGIAPGAEGKIIRLVAPGDLITFVENTLAQTTVDSAGKFDFSVELKTPLYIGITVDFHRADLYFEPGKFYYVKCAPMNYKRTTEVNPLIQSENIQVQGLNSDADDLNFFIQQFNVLYNNFLMQHFNALYRDRNKAVLDTFRTTILTSFKDTKNFYFGTYVRYKMAGLEQLAKAGSIPQIAKKYFMDSPVFYENTEYMDFFNQFFSKYLTVTSKETKYTDFPKMISTIGSYQNLMKTLAQDTVLRKPQLRELVLLKNLMEMFNMPGYNQESILSLLDNISKESKFDGNKLVAADMIRFLTQFRAGTPAPSFILRDRYRKELSLKDLQGKPVVLNFWTTYCQGCLTEMDLLKPIYDKYKDKISVVSISADNQFEKMVYFVSLKKDFGWIFLHIGDQIQLLKDYDVRTYPLYVIIDEQGKIYKYMADLPGNGLEATLDKMLSK